LAGFLNAFELSNNSKFLDGAGRIWEYIGRNLIDHIHGEWFWRINPAGWIKNCRKSANGKGRITSRGRAWKR